MNIKIKIIKENPDKPWDWNEISYNLNITMDFINENPDIVPFNAGQFLFMNSQRMKKHFDNVRWLRSVWRRCCSYPQDQR